MKLTEQKKEELEKKMRDAGLISEQDTIQECVDGDLWEFGSQVRGRFYFTNEKFLFLGGLLGASNFNVPYDKITEVKLCNVGGLIPIIPTGIKVTYTKEDGNVEKKKCSVMKRKDWLAYLIDKGAKAAE